jgi:hypothetical protein
METRSIPEAPGLWPKVYPVTSYRPSAGRLTLEIPGLSEAPLLTALSRAIHLEMRAAGEWAACIDEPREKGLPGLRGLPGPIEFCRLRLENASRLLAIYTALHGGASYLGELDLNPEALKASASCSYAGALHAARAPRPNQDKPLSPPSIPTRRQN